MILQDRIKQGKIRKEEVEKYAEELIRVMQNVSNDKELLKTFLQDILSPAEYKELGIRWQIVKQLSEGKSHRDVAKNLHTGVATVTRGSRALADSKGGFRQVLQVSAKKK